MPRRTPTVVFWKAERELPDVDFATRAEVRGETILLSRRGHPALSPRVQVVFGNTVRKWNGEFAAALLTDRGPLRILPDGTVELLDAQGGAKKIASGPEGFGPRVGAASAFDGAHVVVGGGEVSGRVVGNGWQFDLKTAQWRQIPGEAPPQMHGEIVFVRDGSALMVGGFVRFPDRGGDISALLKGEGWMPLTSPAAEKTAVASQIAFEDGNSGRLLFARAHGLRAGKGRDDTAVYLVEADGRFEQIARVPPPDETSWQAVALAHEAGSTALIAIGQAAKDRGVRVYRAELKELIAGLGQMKAPLRPERAEPELPKKLAEVVTVAKVQGKSDLIGCVAREVGYVTVSTCEKGRWVKTDRYQAKQEAAATSLQRSTLLDLLALDYRLEEVPPNDAFAILTPPVAEPKPVPEKTLVADPHGPVQLGGDPDGFLDERWPRCRSCSMPLSFVARFEGKAVGLQRHSAVSAFICFYCEDPQATAVVLERPSPVKWKRAGSGRTKRIAPSFARLLKPSKDAPSKTGGAPSFLKAPTGAMCHYCGAEQRFVAQLDASLNKALPFGDNGRGYLFICPAEHEGFFTYDSH